MGANLMTLRRLTRSRVGVPLQDDFFPDAVIDDHINLAVQALEAEYHWPWSDVVDSVVIGPSTPTIPIPDGYRATRGIYDGTVELSLVAPGDLISWSGTTGDVPRVWCPMGTALIVLPTPQDDAYSLQHYWYRQPAWLRQDMDESLVPDQFTGAIIAKAAQLLATRESSGADVGRHGTEYTDWLNRMRRDVRRTTGPVRVRVRPGGWV